MGIGTDTAVAEPKDPCLVRWPSRLISAIIAQPSLNYNLLSLGCRLERTVGALETSGSENVYGVVTKS